MGQRNFVRDNSLPFVASQSSLRTLQDCEKRFSLQYIEGAEKDPDYRAPSYYGFGRAFHSVMELEDPAEVEAVLQGMAIQGEIDWDKDVPRLLAMARSYAEAIEGRDEHVIAKELEIVTASWVMYIDAVVMNTKGEWWIVDYKSAGSLAKHIREKVVSDWQVNLYSAHREEIAAKLEIDATLFQGFSYREVLKPLERLKKGETREQYIWRMAPEVRITDVPAADLQEQQAIGELFVLLGRARAMQAKQMAPVPNRSQCYSQISGPCQYYSRCHGKLYTSPEG